MIWYRYALWGDSTIQWPTSDPSLNFFSPLLVRILKFYHLSKFQLYDIIIQFYHYLSKFIVQYSSFTHTNFNYRTTVIMLCIRSEDLSHLITECLYPFTNLSPFSKPPSPWQPFCSVSMSSALLINTLSCGQKY